MSECSHRRIKKNFPFGRNARPRMKCKDCDSPVSKLEIRANQKQKRRKK